MPKSDDRAIREDGPFATVAICTHDRLDDVRRCLAGLMPQARENGMSVLVVDSGSPEPSASGLEQLARTSGAVYHRVDEPGVSLARNTAMAVAGGEWIVWLDDDAVPREGWARSVLSSLRGASEDVAVVGGRILPAFPAGASSDHVDGEWMLLLSCVDDPETGDVAAGKNICGANMAMRIGPVSGVGGFPLDLGRMGKRLISCEEAFVIEALRDAGFRSVYDPSFVVDHHVPAARLKLDWAKRRVFWESASTLRMARKLGRRIPWSVNPLKLAASIPVLWAMGTARGWPRSMTFRMARARGALSERMGLNA